MANSILTIDMITRSAVSLFKNSNMFIQNVNTQYDDQFALAGAKIGDTLRIRLPNDFTVTKGPALQAQDTSEQYTSLTISDQDHIDVAYTSAEKSLKLDDYAERILMPKLNLLAGSVAYTMMSAVEGGVCNFVSNVDGSGNIISPTSTTALLAKAALESNSAPQSPGRKIVMDEYTEARIVGTLSGLFNPTPEISEQYRTGQMKSALGFDWYMDQTVIKHTAGTFTAGTVNGAGQTGTSIAVNAISGTLKKGDIITFDACYMVNRVTKQTTGKLRQFVVTADVPSGGTSIPIYPAMVPSSGGQAVQYQTVDNSPANSANVNLSTKASEIYRKNIAYAPEAVTLATADLVMPTKGVEEAARKSYNGISMRMLTSYVPGTDQLVSRLDVLYGYKFVRPEWACVLADAV